MHTLPAQTHDPFLSLAERSRLGWYIEKKMMMASHTSLTYIAEAHELIRSRLLEPHPNLFPGSTYSLEAFTSAFIIINQRTFSFFANATNLKTLARDFPVAADIADAGRYTTSTHIPSSSSSAGPLEDNPWTAQPGSGGSGPGGPSGPEQNEAAPKETQNKRTSPLNPMNRTTALVPWADFLNHHWPDQKSKTAYSEFAYDYNHSTSSWEVRADQNYSKDEQVFISYGMHGNAVMLHHYNLVLRDNPSEEAVLFLDVLIPECKFHLAWAGQPYAEWAGGLCGIKWQWLQTLELDETWQIEFRLDGYPVGRKAIQALRVRAITAADIEALGGLAGAFSRLSEGSPVTPQSELRVHQTLLLAMENGLKAFDTTVWDDMLLLARAQRGGGKGAAGDENGPGDRGEDDGGDEALPPIPEMGMREKLMIAQGIETKRIMLAVVLRSLQCIYNVYDVINSDSLNRMVDPDEPNNPYKLWQFKSADWLVKWYDWWQELEENTHWETLVYG